VLGGVADASFTTGRPASAVTQGSGQREPEQGHNAYIVVWAEASSAAEGDSARVESIAAYGDNALVFTAGICEPA
jgi:hypothetical protein